MARSADALVLERPRRIRRQAFDLPEIGDDDALLRVEACGLCGTDHEQYCGVVPSPFPVIPGHETVGVLDAVGAKAQARWKVKPGDRVAVEVFQSCRQCRKCLGGDYRKCEKHGLADMYGFITAKKAPSLWGGYSQYQYLSPDSLLLPIGGRIAPTVATLFNPLGAGVQWGVKIPGTKQGDVVAVLGPGIRGLACAAAAKLAGAGFVMVTGVGPKDDERLSLAPRFGADLAVDIKKQDPAAALSRAAGQLADIVVDVTAKAPGALAQAIQLVRPGGTIVIAGTRGSAQTPGFWPDLIVYKEIRIVGALGVDTDSYRRALEILESGTFPFADLPRQTAGFDAMEELLKIMAGEGAPAPVHGVFIP